MSMCCLGDLTYILCACIVAKRKAQAACAQSFTLSQQATIEFTCHDHSVIACSHHIYILLFFAHIPFVVNRTFKRNTNGEVATVSIN